jgi:hypothetical protein
MNDFLSVGVILENDSDYLMLVIIRDDFKVFDEPFLLKNFRNLSFRFRGRDIHLFEFRPLKFVWYLVLVIWCLSATTIIRVAS